jgi:hypothetical protein
MITFQRLCCRLVQTFALLLLPLPAFSQLDSWSFADTNNWTTDLGFYPMSYSNIIVSTLGPGNSLEIDGQTNAWLEYNVYEESGATNLNVVSDGSVIFWFAPNWASTSDTNDPGTTGPGVCSRLLEIGTYTTNASYGWWSLYMDTNGNDIYFSAQDADGDEADYLSAPVTFTSNVWHLIALTWTSTNTALFVDGKCLTNGPGISVLPSSDVLAEGFTIGSDAATGTLQMNGAINSLASYNYALESNSINDAYILNSIFYLRNANDLGNFTNAPYAIPDSVSNIGEFAFASTVLSGITLTNGITSIELGAFSGCINLASLVIPGTVTNIGEYAFDGSSLTNITMAEGVTSVGDLAFYNCLSLVSVAIPGTVTNIGGYAFAYTGLVSVAIPDGVTTIENDAFYLCPNLASVTIADSVTSIGAQAFYKCPSLTNITIPASANQYGIYGYAFADSGLETVTIADGVTNIGNEMFFSCTNLTNVTIPPSLTVIGDEAFQLCTSLASVTIPNGVITIGEGAFNFCTGLSSVTIPSSVTSIGDQAFEMCTNLVTITIPSSVTNIGDYAFAFCYNLAEVYFQGNAPNADSSVFISGINPTVYYLPDTTGWDDFSTNTGLAVILWDPLIQTSDSNFGIRANQFGFDITGTADIPIVVEACTNLASPVWFPLQTLTLTNGLVYFSDPQWTNYPTRYYRISSP